MEAKDELHARGPAEAGSVLLKVVKDCADGDAGVEGAGDVQLFTYVGSALARMRLRAPNSMARMRL